MRAVDVHQSQATSLARRTKLTHHKAEELQTRQGRDGSRWELAVDAQQAAAGGVSHVAVDGQWQPRN